MSDFERHQDELISAYLDGEADPDEAARIEGDPQSRARAADLAAVIHAVADPVQGLTPRERDRLRARALAAAPSPAPVRDISDTARRRWRLVLIPAAAAAGIFAVALGVISLRSGIDDDASETAASAPATTAASSSEMAAQSAADDMSDMAEPAAEDFAEEEAEATISASTESPATDDTTAEPEAPDTEEADDAGAVTDQAPDAPSVADLGSFDGPEQLIDHLALRLDHAEPALDGPHVEPGPCAEAVADRVAELGGEALIEARAELRIETGGSPEEAGVDLAVITTEDGDFLLVYAAEPSCEIETAALE